MSASLHEEKQWLEESLITQDQFEKMSAIRSGKIFSIFWELQFTLYMGILLLTAGLGILIYKYIGSIGHIIAILVMMGITAWLFYYIFSRGKAYSNNIVESPNAYYDYFTLLAALFVSLTITYIEVQFEPFDAFWTYLPLFISVIYFFLSYRFDHRGVLALAIISLASFFGLNIQPDILNIDSVFQYERYSYTGIVLGILLVGVALTTERADIKAHFKIIYMNFAAWLVFGGVLSGCIEDGTFSLIGLIGLIVSGACIYYSWIEKSSWFAVYGVTAAYILITSMIVEVMDEHFFVFIWYYFLLSPIAPIWVIFNMNKAFKK